jgi:aspartyl-tRNA(Asn)/glutamyl-tRNA(Gln) amidotransferase subunit A
MNIKSLTISSVHEGLVKKDFSCAEITGEFLRWIEMRNAEVNAFITVTPELAFNQAKIVDEKIAGGRKLGVLEGVPAAIKDNILVEDIRATAGSKILENYQAVYSATVVNKLNDAGAIILGKTNMDEFAMGASGETSAFGATRNPHDFEKVPGGSSAGSAAAVADGQAVYALGSDTGGSIRQPAAFCGLVGLKPTYGRVSRHGLVAMASSFDQIGPIAKTVEDAAIVFEAIAGRDDFDATAIDQPARVLKNLKKKIKGLKIGVPKEFFVDGMDPVVEKAVRAALEELKKAGATIKEVSLPLTKYALATYYILMPAEVSANLARFDGVRFGARADAANLLETYLNTRSLGFGDEVKRRIMLGTFVLSHGYEDEYYAKALKLRSLIKADFDQVFREVDCLFTPTAPTVAFNLGEKFDDPLTMYLADIFTVSANVAGLPALSLPIGFKGNLPIGGQIIGRRFDEAGILNAAYQLEKILDKNKK